MKKIVILGTALLALNAVASEVQLKVGHDFYRRNRLDGSNETIKPGLTGGLEYIFDNQGEFEWGIGAEYKFGNNSSYLRIKDNNGKAFRNIPVYALGKFNLVTTDRGNDALYLVGRLGYGFVKESQTAAAANKINGGLYVAAGVGTEFGALSLEAIFERTNAEYVKSTSKSNANLDSFGLRLGYRFGNLVNDRKPQIITREVVRTEVREVPVNVPVPTPVVRTQNTRTAVLPFNCSAEEQKCVIRGFKVDGRVPNEAEARDLGTIANIINQFAEGGSIDFVGHTDSTGSAAYNQKLSVARAQNVARLLREYGLKDTITYGTITGKGLTEPADTNSTVEGRYNNRRVELFFNNVDFSNVQFISQ